ncbi:MAG: hypothetical protein KIG74_02040 [Clostridiaceae bacterium]|nr:hypothetical protein [Clostridiaceae bacterium]MDD6274570.1 hypothetical protein [Clostridiaceae bacterium]
MKAARQLLAFVLLLTMLTGCAAPGLRYPGYEDLSFHAGALEYIGKKRRDIAEKLGIETQTEPVPLIQVEESVTVAGEAYALSYRFDGNYVGYEWRHDPTGDDLVLSAITYQRKLDGEDVQTRREAVLTVFQLMQDELGKPEQIADAFENKTIDYALNAGFPTTPVSAKWLISEKPDYPKVIYSGGYEGDQTILIAELRVTALPAVWTLEVSYKISNTRNSEMERFSSRWNW